MSTFTRSQPSPSGAQTLTNGLNVLRAVAEGARSQVEIRQKLELSRSTVGRLVATLRDAGFLRDSEIGLVLGPALISLGFTAIEENELQRIAQPLLERLASQVLDTIHLAINDDDSALYLVKIPGTRGAETRSRVGLRMPLTRTGIGKSLLLDQPSQWERQYHLDASAASTQSASHIAVQDFVKHMTLCRALGITLDVEENEPGVRCVAAPVRGPRGEITAAISVTATTPYMPMRRMRELVPVVLNHANQIGLAIGAPDAFTVNTMSDLDRATQYDMLFDFQ